MAGKWRRRYLRWSPSCDGACADYSARAAREKLPAVCELRKKLMTMGLDKPLGDPTSSMATAQTVKSETRVHVFSVNDVVGQSRVANKAPDGHRGRRYQPGPAKAL